MNASFLPRILEWTIVCHACILLFSVDIFSLKFTRRTKFLLVGSIAAMTLSMVIGGLSVAPMVIKTSFFAIMMLLAVRHPTIARKWLLVAIACELLSQASVGNILDKMSAVPFLLLAVLWAATKSQFGGRERRVVLMAMLAEFTQAILIESRGFLITVIAAALVLPLNPLPVRRLVTFSVTVVPIFYPIALSLVLLSFLLGLDLFEPTISNFERSTLAAWCLSHLHDFVLTGPGAQQYFDSTNDVLLFMQRGRDDIIDPHSFALSAWVSLGTITTAVLYALWCNAWSIKPTLMSGIDDRRVKLFAIMALLALFPFTLSPPDFSRRILVALIAGIAIAGMRDPAALKISNENPKRSRAAPTSDEASSNQTSDSIGAV